MPSSVLTSLPWSPSHTPRSVATRWSQASTLSAGDTKWSIKVPALMWEALSFLQFFIETSCYFNETCGFINCTVIFNFPNRCKLISESVNADLTILRLISESESTKNRMEYACWINHCIFNTARAAKLQSSQSVQFPAKQTQVNIGVTSD